MTSVENNSGIILLTEINKYAKIEPDKYDPESPKKTLLLKL